MQPAPVTRPRTIWLSARSGQQQIPAALTKGLFELGRVRDVDQAIAGLAVMSSETRSNAFGSADDGGR